MNINQEKDKPKASLIKDDSYKNEPSSDFKEIDVIPGERLLTTLSNKELVIMPEKGSFPSNHRYLDVIFRLLHEDAVNPLRAGIMLLRAFS